MSITTTDETGRAARRRAPRWVPAVASIVLVAGVFAGVRTVRASSDGPRPPAASAAGMPTSAAIEDTYGIRFDVVALTADDGVVQLRYTVLDQTKADQLHEQQPWIELADGSKLDQPGISGHGGHSKNTPNAGRSAYVLLANTKSKVRSGAVVTVHLAELELRGVPVQG